MIIESLQTDNASAVYNTETNIATVTYRGALTPSVTAQAYQWLFINAVKIGVENINGGIFDFREVTTFELANIRTVKREKTVHADKVNFNQIPTALMVKTLYQEQMVRVSMRVTEQSDRLRIVYSEEDALAFIKSWHQNKANKSE